MTVRSKYYLSYIIISYLGDGNCIGREREDEEMDDTMSNTDIDIIRV
mgnify:CR=1 FL=1